MLQFSCICMFCRRTLTYFYVHMTSTLDHVIIEVGTQHPNGVLSSMGFIFDDCKIISPFHTLYWWFRDMKWSYYSCAQLISSVFHGAWMTFYGNEMYVPVLKTSFRSQEHLQGQFRKVENCTFLSFLPHFSTFEIRCVPNMTIATYWPPTLLNWERNHVGTCVEVLQRKIYFTHDLFVHTSHRHCGYVQSCSHRNIATSLPYIILYLSS